MSQKFCQDCQLHGVKRIKPILRIRVTVKEVSGLLFISSSSFYFLNEIDLKQYLFIATDLIRGMWHFSSFWIIMLYNYHITVFIQISRIVQFVLVDRVHIWLHFLQLTFVNLKQTFEHIQINKNKALWTCGIRNCAGNRICNFVYVLQAVTFRRGRLCAAD